MAKPRVEYVCEKCGGTSVKWQGRCPHCGEWNTMKEFKIAGGASARFGSDKHRAHSLIRPYSRNKAKAMTKKSHC